MILSTSISEVGIRQAQANARLIAAAPDLLEALRGLVELVNIEFREYPELATARAAIIRAEGN